MDEFGVLTERYGLKPQGKSAPMAASKRPTSTSSGQAWNFGANVANARASAYSSGNAKSANGSLLDNDDPFNSNSNHGPGLDNFDFLLNLSSDTSKSSYTDDLIFGNSGNSAPKASSNKGLLDDDIFGGIPGLKTSNSTDNHIFGSFASTAKKNASVDDLLGDLTGFGSKGAVSNFSTTRNSGKDNSGYGDLLSGFNQSRKGITEDDPFAVLESTSTSTFNSTSAFVDPLDELANIGGSQSTKPGSSLSSTKLKPPPKAAQAFKPGGAKSSDKSSIDELENFAMGRAQTSVGVRSGTYHAKEVRNKQNAKGSKFKEAEDASTKMQQNSVDDLESFFSASHRSSSVPKSRVMNEDPLFDSLTSNKNVPVKKAPPVVSTGLNKASSGDSIGTKKSSSSPSFFDDFSSIFGAASINADFEEIEGESEERRRARFSRHQRTNDRVAQAVADMNQRDQQAQIEQEERYRIAERLDVNIKRWAAGKEGNMRALLSSLQDVLWMGSGWNPISLTDLITSNSVKKAYKKATLFVHPDKVQQKGATLEQKYTAEKVFDILKEAWNKFSKEELR